jgi:hypothetical protein
MYKVRNASHDGNKKEQMVRYGYRLGVRGEGGNDKQGITTQGQMTRRTHRVEVTET